MEILQEINENKDIAIALGFFDGIHIGHKKIITTLVQKANEKGIKSAIITFDKNPSNYFNESETPNLQTYKDREIILESLGVDYLYELDFEKYKDMEASEYLQNVLVENFKPQLIVVGYNHHFGKDKTGSPALLQEYSSVYNYDCIVIPEQFSSNNEQISSTEIRKKITYGDLNKAKELLGRPFSVRNSVIKGAGIARTLGYPTANIIWPNSMVKLPYGVYFGYVQVKGKLTPSLISWGTKPTLTNGKTESLEAHLYDTKENLYGKIIKILFIRRLRYEEKFPNIKLLAEQIKKDYKAFEIWAKLAK